MNLMFEERGSAKIASICLIDYLIICALSVQFNSDCIKFSRIL